VAKSKIAYILIFRKKIQSIDADAEGALRVAAMNGERRELGDRTPWRAFARVLFMRLKVIVAIHWEALRPG